MAGNRSGPRGWFAYVDDLGDTYAIFTDVDLANAAGLSPAVLGTPEKKTRLQPRYVVAKSIAGTPTSRQVICNPTNTVYANGGVLTIDGEQFRATGRVGEKYTFPQLAVPGP